MFRRTLGCSYITYVALTSSKNNCHLQWLDQHPQFMSNQLYIGGESYCGIIIPALTLEIDKLISKFPNTSTFHYGERPSQMVVNWYYCYIWNYTGSNEEGVIAMWL